MKKIPFAVVKMVNIVLLMIPFLICWTLYYEPRTTTVGSKQVSVLVMIIFFFICYYFGQRLDCFRVSILQIRDVIFGEVLAVMITDIIMYILIKYIANTVKSYREYNLVINTISIFHTHSNSFYLIFCFFIFDFKYKHTDKKPFCNFSEYFFNFFYWQIKNLGVSFK